MRLNEARLDAGLYVAGLEYAAGEVARAHDEEGISLSEIGRAPDVSRQRVRVLVELGRKAGR